jgi:glycosyltransferase involved in cell wall biosynthesis
VANAGNPTHSDFGKACVEVRNEADLARALRDLAARPDLRAELRQAARQAASSCSAANVAAEYDRLLRLAWGEK